MCDDDDFLGVMDIVLIILSSLVADLGVVS